MTLTNTQDRYGSVAKVFHWLTALLILTALPTGMVANGLPVDADNLPLKVQLFSIHKTLGVTAFFVALLRIVWALTQPKPGLLNAEMPFGGCLAEA
ncbi:MAG: cytochrome b/b6 domain-containing protein, partial [Pseudomonadota bacterium]